MRTELSTAVITIASVKIGAPAGAAHFRQCRVDVGWRQESDERAKRVAFDDPATDEVTVFLDELEFRSRAQS